MKKKTQNGKVKSGENKNSFWTNMKKGYNPMEEGVRWTEKYADDLERIWKKTPVFLQKLLVVLAVLLLGSSLKGEFKIKESFKNGILLRKDFINPNL